MAITILTLALFGLAISSYFTLTYYGLLKFKKPLIPDVLCQREEKKCRSVLGTPEAKVFGVPNSVLGQAFYLLLLGFSIALLLQAKPPAWLSLALGVAAWLSVLFGIFLTWALLFRIRKPCQLCILSHLLNFIIAIVLTLSLQKPL